MISQIVPIPELVQHVPGRNTSAKHELLFLASLPPLGYKIYNVIKSSKKPSPENKALVSIGNEVFHYEKMFIIDN